VGLAFLLFLPFLDFKLPNSLKLKFTVIGALQIGVMYLFYYHSFKLLSVSEVALFTIFTPFWVSLLAMAKEGKFAPRVFLAALLCITGAAIIKYSSLSADFWLGFWLVQAANFVFALGQVGYKFLCEDSGTVSHRSVFGYFFLGATLVGLVSFLALGNFSRIPTDARTWAVLVYLGLVASGVGYFAWNKGATLVSGGVLAVMNNAVIPLAILVELFVFGASVSNWTTFLVGSAVMFCALLVAEKGELKTKNEKQRAES